MSGDEPNVAEVLRRAARAFLEAPTRRPQMIVHPDSVAWARNPVGLAPSREALYVAMWAGTVPVDSGRLERGE